MENEIEINGEVYVKKTKVDESKTPYVLVRGDRSGVFAGYLESREGREVKLSQCRRIWTWYGAASISQLAIDGTSKPDQCKFPEATETHFVLDAIEVVPATTKAKESIQAVKPWKQ